MEDGDVMYTQSKGFRLNGRVVRVSFGKVRHSQNFILTSILLLQAAKVGVVKNA
jgi:hypothetical protein